MSSFLDAFESGITAVKSNPVVAEYAGPVLMAVLTGQGSFSIGKGKITITQSGQPARFTLGTAFVALETFLLTDETSIQVGTTVIAFDPTGAGVPALAHATAAA